MRHAVDLGDRSYPIEVVAGDLAGLGACAAGVLQPGRAVVVTNPVVGAYYLQLCMQSLRGAGFDPVAVMVPDGESSKTVATWQALVTDLLQLRVDRQTPVFALGGGVTGDIAGFAAATTLRGLPLVQVPTSLLAMVDSAVGGKTGVNTPKGKNLVGAFHQPSLVYAALGTLDTLPIEEFRSGLGEAIKHGVIRDAEMFARCEAGSAAVAARDPAAVADLVVGSCRVKASVVAEDERESGMRAILNFGHTAGHAVETAAGHGRLRHGECVALGMLAECRWAANRMGGPADLFARLDALYERLGLARVAPPLSLESLTKAASVDKKRLRGTIHTAVPVALGEVRLCRIGTDEVPYMLSSIPGLLED